MYACERSNVGEAHRAERLQQIVTSLSKAKDKTLTHMKRVSGSIV